MKKTITAILALSSLILALQPAVHAEDFFEEELTSVPPTVTPGPTHTPVLSDVHDSIVTGLENRLLMEHGAFYEFTVIGAGTDNDTPGEGDTRWVPVYWRMKRGTVHQKDWRIGAVRSISDALDIPILIYLREDKYTNGAWVPTGVEESIEEVVMTKSYQPTPSPTPTPEPADILPAVTGLKASSNRSKTILLSWETVPGADGYLVLGQNPAHACRQIGCTTKHTWTDKDAVTDEWNYYWVIPFYTLPDGTVIQGTLSDFVYALAR